MAATCEQEVTEVEENPGESLKINDLNVIINGKNNEYITINIFRVIFKKRTVKLRFFSLFKRVCQRVTLRVIFGHCHCHHHHRCCYLSVNYSFPWSM